jgi:hypothetical protein
MKEEISAMKTILLILKNKFMRYSFIAHQKTDLMNDGQIIH